MSLMSIAHPTLAELLAGPKLTSDSTTQRFALRAPTLRELLAGKDPGILMPNETAAPPPKTDEEVFAEKFPATAKFHKVRDSADAIERFIEWCEGQKRLTLMTQIAAKIYSRSTASLESMVVEFFGLDMAAVEREAPLIEEYYEALERDRLAVEAANARAFAAMNAEGTAAAARMEAEAASIATSGASSTGTTAGHARNLSE